MSGSYIPGVVLIAIGAVLLFIGLPDRSGQSPRFFRFEASLVLYPPLIMVFFALGAMQLVMALVGR